MKNQWTAMCSPVGLGMGFIDFGDYLVAPDGREILVAFQTVKTGDVATTQLPDGRIRDTLINPLSINPMPGTRTMEMLAALRGEK